MRSSALVQNNCLFAFGNLAVDLSLTEISLGAEVFEGPRDTTSRILLPGNGGCRMMPYLGSKVSSPSPISVAEFYDAFAPLWIRLVGQVSAVRKKPGFGISFPNSSLVKLLTACRHRCQRGRRFHGSGSSLHSSHDIPSREAAL